MVPEEMGPPHIWAAGGLMKALLSHAQELGKRNFEELQKVYESYEGMSIAERANLFRVCRTDNMWKSSQRRLSLFLADSSISNLLVACLQQTGAVRKQGRAPASFLERELQEFAEALQL